MPFAANPLGLPFILREMKASTPEPLVSIITVVYNAREELQAVLESVFPHRSVEVELIVVDGGSRDGTVEYLSANAGRIDFWTSEPDRGIYDAMNKAIKHARGTYLLHLNAGDKLLNVPLEELRAGREAAVDILAFRVELERGRHFKPGYGYGLAFTNTLHHQGTFFRRAVFPGYNDRYRIFADFDANQRMSKAAACGRIYDKVVSFHATDGVSNQNTAKAAKEFFEVIRGNHGSKALPVAWIICKWEGFCRRLGWL